MANGPDGLAISDSRNGVVVLPDGIRLPATSAHGGGNHNGRSRIGSPPTRKTLKGSEYETDQEWHLRNMQYGDGWAYDSTQSHYKRAKPTYTDLEDD